MLPCSSSLPLTVSARPDWSNARLHISRFLYDFLALSLVWCLIDLSERCPCRRFCRQRLVVQQGHRRALQAQPEHSASREPRVSLALCIFRLPASLRSTDISSFNLLATRPYQTVRYLSISTTMSVRGSPRSRTGTFAISPSTRLRPIINSEFRRRLFRFRGIRG